MVKAGKLLVCVADAGTGMALSKFEHLDGMHWPRAVHYPVTILSFQRSQCFIRTGLRYPGRSGAFNHDTNRGFVVLPWTRISTVTDYLLQCSCCTPR